MASIEAVQIPVQFSVFGKPRWTPEHDCGTFVMQFDDFDMYFAPGETAWVWKVEQSGRCTSYCVDCEYQGGVPPEHMAARVILVQSGLIPPRQHIEALRCRISDAESAASHAKYTFEQHSRLAAKLRMVEAMRDSWSVPQ